MIFYHGASGGGTNYDARKFLTGRHGLVSFARPEQMPIVTSVCKSFVLDNGAFTYWKQGGKLNVDTYLEWVKTYSSHCGLDFALIPDVIDGSEEVNDALIAEWPRYLPGAPVWHMHESLPKLERLVDEWDIVALGSSGDYAEPGAHNWWLRIAEAMQIACDENGFPKTGLHGLRMMNPSIFEHIPFRSVDSTNATQNGQREQIKLGLPERWQGATVIAWRLEGYSPATRWSGFPPQGKLFT